MGASRQISSQLDKFLPSPASSYTAPSAIAIMLLPLLFFIVLFMYLWGEKAKRRQVIYTTKVPSVMQTI